MKRELTSNLDWMQKLPAIGIKIAEHFSKSEMPLIITIKRGAKTLEQLGYFHSEVLPSLTRALVHTGEIKRYDEDAAKLWLKMLIVFGKWYEINGTPVFDAKSFEKASIDTLMVAIDRATDEAQLRGEYVAPPKSKPKNGETK